VATDRVKANRLREHALGATKPPMLATTLRGEWAVTVAARVDEPTRTASTTTPATCFGDRTAVHPIRSCRMPLGLASSCTKIDASAGRG